MKKYGIALVLFVVCFINISAQQKLPTKVKKQVLTDFLGIEVLEWIHFGDGTKMGDWNKKNFIQKLQQNGFIITDAEESVVNGFMVIGPLLKGEYCGFNCTVYPIATGNSVIAVETVIELSNRNDLIAPRKIHQYIKDTYNVNKEEDSIDETKGTKTHIYHIGPKGSIEFKYGDIYNTGNPTILLTYMLDLSTTILE